MHDMFGRPVRLGQECIVRFKVTRLHGEPDFCNVNLEGLETMPGNGTKVMLSAINTKQIEVIEMGENPMRSFRKKPVVIQAIQFQDTAERLCELSDFISNQDLKVDYTNPEKPAIKIETLEGIMLAFVGDWIIKGINGEFYPCKPDIFAKTYDQA